MKNINKMISVFLATLLFLFSFLFASCDNPLFIKATGLYEVTFSTNGGSSVASLRTDKIKEEPFTSRSEYTFSGWHKTSDFSDENVKFPLEITEDTTLYAKWLQEFSVSFETNGGDKIDSYKTGIISESPNTSRTNYIFAGWFLNSEFSGNQINFPYNVTKPVTLYAKWIPTYLATFECGEGSEISSYRTTTISSSPETKHDGFTFAGWYLDSGFTRKADFPFTLEADTTFYAKWQQIYKVKFETNGGTNVSDIQAGFIESSPRTTKTDFGFGGWFSSSDFSEETKIEFPYTVTSDITLYAKWTAIQCAITYYANGATSGTVPESTTVDKGSSYTVLGNTGNLEKTGFAFTKWNARADGIGSSYSAGSTITVASDVSLYAQWGKEYAAMIKVEAGTFFQGGTHDVTLSGFYIGQYEVTYELWEEVKTWASAQETDWNIGTANKGVTENDKYTDWEPATSVSWYQAITWCNAYSEMKGLTPCYYSDSSYKNVYRDYSSSGYIYWNKSANGYRLPTESEWEYAAKGGPNQKSYTYSGSNTIGEVAWYSSNSGSETHPVGTKKANSLGIYDMSGNVAEWCGTSYYSYSTDAQTNPNYWYYSEKRFGDPIYRGGSWQTSSDAAKVEYRRSKNYGTDYDSGIGFRVARNAE